MAIWNPPADIKAAFFDVDGTLLSFATHMVPETTLMALAELKKLGVKCFIATGRPPYQLDEISIDTFEGFILFNGQLCLTRDEVYYDGYIDREDVRAIVQQVKEGRYNALFMEKGRCYLSGHDDHVRAIEESVAMTFPEGDIEQALENDIYQLNIYLGPGETGIVSEVTSNIKMTRWSEHFVDAFPRYGGKHAAVRRTLERYGIAPEQAVAFGDGGNDLSMFGVVGTSVAMGNGNDDVKLQADFVTDDVDHDGIYNAFVRLGVL
ncbi:Cof-type HAD-IIB family hydrolase [Olsenella sp. HMSC062G07]|uniref:Cof-type HAD-IIB family hydrolase n=1 Tax=Olsenella sp. HMSC062G07 TaxID=1739330 RepID=UPI0008A38881|nr:Cof-type HAD-IIB family hydrolase [Olsenella sp. HMSC062G07]OFK22401.1 haloacid dehalogenase [Olsenella sp. HMSC062G07]